ncbi:MAG: FAD-dependent oxidoreductase [Actinomycetia bacterium]|nr:FAD-dependent oxidoreductase [Actinomycetes bacterium]
MTMTGRSLWLDELDPSPPARPPLGGDRDVDVAIVGGGFTGLWTAYYLKKLDPTLDVLVIEREHVGFGASGRNGGWVVAELAAGLDRYAKQTSLDEAIRQERAVFDTVGEIGGFVAEHGVSCGFAKGGAIRLARNDPQHRRQIEEIDHHRSLGFGEDDFQLLSADDARTKCNATDVLGGIWFAHCASVDPARLVTGMATVCEDMGTKIVERTAATQIGPGRVVTDLGVVRAGHVVQATEGYTRDLEGERRRLLPLYSRMVATEPLSEAMWDEIGLDTRPTFCDDRYMVIYGQRTEDDRIAFGGRGVPYLYGSTIDPASESRGESHQLVHEALVGLFPALEGVEITHRWGGVMGVPRDWAPFVHHDPAGFSAAGGYIGEGVAPSNLAGRTLAELITKTDSERVTLPWVGGLPRRWEPEPLRWLGVRSSRWVMGRADAVEDGGRESKVAVKLSQWLRGS